MEGMNIPAEELSRLKAGSDLPNARTATYICGMLVRSQVESPSHDAMVTTANLAVLLAWDRGVGLPDLDAVQFNVLCPSGGPPRLEIERGPDSVSIPVVDRSFSLGEPWDGSYRVSKVVQGTHKEEPVPHKATSGRESPTEQGPPMEAVWQNWKNGESLCEGCPGRDSFYPLGGLGDRDSNLMLVAKEPNYNVEENTVRKELSWPDAKQAMEEDRRTPPNPLWRQLRTVAEAADLGGPTDLYFTNPAKCNDRESRWEERYDHCRGYLSRELETVSPDVLLLYGRRAIEATYEAYGLDQPSKVTEVHARPREESGRTLVPLCHWAYAMRGGWIDEYNQEVATLVRNLF